MIEKYMNPTSSIVKQLYFVIWILTRTWGISDFDGMRTTRPYSVHADTPFVKGKSLLAKFTLQWIMNIVWLKPKSQAVYSRKFFIWKKFQSRCQHNVATTSMIPKARLRVKPFLLT